MNLVRTLMVSALAASGIGAAQPADILAKIPASYLARGAAPDSHRYKGREARVRPGLFAFQNASPMEK